MTAAIKSSAPAPVPNAGTASSSTSRSHLPPPPKPSPLFTTTPSNTTGQPSNSGTFTPRPPSYTTATGPRNNLKRRRSSYPPATSATTDVFDISLWTKDPAPGLIGGKIKKEMAPYDGSDTNWETLLNLTPSSTPDNPFDNLFDNHNIGYKLGDASGSYLSPGRIAQTAQDLAWKTILGSTVHVESLGNVDVARLLREIWKRGGGDIVSNQCLWPSIIIALATEDMPQQRIPPPSAAASLALQALYNMTLRKWEASVFSGLLGQFINNSNPHSQTARQSFSEAPIYGAATPTKEFDASQWTNLTPGFDWTTLLNTTGGAEIGPFDPREDFVGGNRRSSIRNEDDQAKGIDELLAEMEEGREANERKASLTKGVTILTPGQTTYTPGQTPVSSSSASASADKGKSRKSPVGNYLPTPETDDSPSTSQNPPTPDQAASPYVTGGSIATTSASISSGVSAVSRALSTGSASGSGSRAPHPTMLNIPVNEFRPPPPMCMFFNPSFKDLTQGKIGAWRGDLNVRHGGKFSVLVIAESGTEDIWQTSTWGDQITYPAPSDPNQGTGLTTNMTPVAHLAQNGYVPTAMAMVLCNDPNVESFCSMVQKLHQEGVAFSLPNARGLPLMFLPAKFDSTDNLQRLGLAYMTKAGAPVPSATARPGSGAGAKESSDTPSSGSEAEKKRKRRQSAPAQAGAGLKGAASRATGSPAGTGAGGGGRAKKRISLGLPKVDEAAEA